MARADTTATIEHAAIELVLERGYTDVTVDMICAAAGVSQRTFFNHFKTKDAAILGSSVPKVDEKRTREFIASTGPLLAEAVGIVDLDKSFVNRAEPIYAERLQAIASHPELLARHMERFAAIDAELREIILLRLRRDDPDSPNLEAQADLIANLVFGTMRFVGERMAQAVEDGGDKGARAELSALIGQVVGRLA